MHWLTTNNNFWNINVSTPLFLVQADIRSLTRDSLSSHRKDPYPTNSPNVHPTTTIMSANYCKIVDVQREAILNKPKRKTPYKKRKQKDKSKNKNKAIHHN